MLTLETQEVGTGKWFPIVWYVPGTVEQREQAVDHGNLMHKVVGLYTRVTGEIVTMNGEGTK